MSRIEGKSSILYFRSPKSIEKTKISKIPSNHVGTHTQCLCSSILGSYMWDTIWSWIPIIMKIRWYRCPDVMLIFQSLYLEDYWELAAPLETSHSSVPETFISNGFRSNKVLIILQVSRDLKFEYLFHLLFTMISGCFLVLSLEQKK